MDLLSDRGFYALECFLVTLGVVVYAVALLVKSLGRRRPGLALGWPLTAAFALRLVGALGVSLTSIGSDLRGGDEPGFIFNAHRVAETPLTSAASLHDLTSNFHKFIFELQIRALDTPDVALRATQIGISVAAIALLSIAVYDLAGPRASAIAAWLLAFEPANVFFSGILHKEPNLFLAEALVAFGGARLWKGGAVTSLLPMGIGCLVALATRPYAGWFLLAASAAIALHASARTAGRSPRSFMLAAGVVLLIALAIPTVWKASSPDRLERELQGSQIANTSDDSNLSLELVDYSTRTSIVTNLPRRIRDVVLRPYLWQVANPSQQFGVLGSLAALGAVVLLIPALWRSRGTILARAGPFVYLGAMLLVAYALSVGNAGTGFRYRTHLVAVALCLLAVLRWWRTEPLPRFRRVRPRAVGEPVVAR